jgi:hypothetical protein
MQNNVWDPNQNPALNNPAQVGVQPPQYQTPLPSFQSPVSPQPQVPYAPTPGPTYQPPMMPTYQAPPSNVSVLNQPLLGSPTVVTIVEPEEDNCCLGCCMGFLFGVFGLLCLLCVRNKRSYIKGWLVPFIIATIVWIVLVVVLVTTIPH